MPCAKLGAAINPSQLINPTNAPVAQVEALDHRMKWSRTKDRIRLAMSDETIPKTMLLRLEGSGVMPSNFIQGLAKSAGEYHAAPRNHWMRAETRMAQWFMC